MLLAIELLLYNAPALGAGDREFKSLYPDSKRNHLSLSIKPRLIAGLFCFIYNHTYSNISEYWTQKPWTHIFLRFYVICIVILKGVNCEILFTGINKW